MYDPASSYRLIEATKMSLNISFGLRAKKYTQKGDTELCWVGLSGGECCEEDKAK